MIPKTIHYCWFGGKSLPKDAIKCIESWRKYLPDYEIIEWNESNFDVNAIPYTAQAYAAGKYAFVSDYARFKILYENGGIYFDTDVEVIKPMNNIISEGPFMGFEKTINGTSGVAPGLGIALNSKMSIIREILDYYESHNFGEDDGTIVKFTTDIFLRHGLKMQDIRQNIAGINIYPSDVLCPMDSTTGLINITPNTISIHHYSCSWINHNTLSFRLHQLKNILIKILGVKRVLWLYSIIKKQ